MATMFPINRAIRKRLTETISGSSPKVFAYVGTRISPEARTQATVLPCIIYSVSMEESLAGLVGTLDSRMSEIELLVLANTAAEASETFEALQVDMKGWEGTVYTTGSGATLETVVINHCIHKKSLTQYQSPVAGETTGTFLYSSIYSVMFTK